MNIDLIELYSWFNAIRKLKSKGEVDIFLDSVWESQISNKLWLIDEINKIVHERCNIYIFGGWTGILSNLLFQKSKFEITQIRSIDINPWCENVADNVNKIHEIDNWKFKAITSNMACYQYNIENSNKNLIINTSTEHINQATYDLWYGLIPDNSIVVAQGNNYFGHKEHIRSTNSLLEFNEINHVKNSLFSGEVENTDFTRFMSIWPKS